MHATEMFYVDSMTWTVGPNLPIKIYSAAGVTSQDGKSFFIVGGYDLGRYIPLETIYRLRCHNFNCEWIQMPQKLRVARRDAVAGLLPKSVATCRKA